MRKKLTVAVVVAQLLVLGVMAGQREWLLAHGQTVYLRTAPVDPRDPMRGDYVRLSYSLNTGALADVRGHHSRQPPPKGSRIYAALRRDQGDVYQLDYLSLQRPQLGPYLAGRVSHSHGGAAGMVHVQYGIEQLFVEQGRGKGIEARRGERNGLQVPMEVAVAVGDSGEAQLKGYRWSRLGLRLTVESPGVRAAAGTPGRSAVLRFTLENVSEAPLTVVDTPAHCALSLRQAEGAAHRFRASERGCSPLMLSPEKLVRLEPGQGHSVVVDLNQPRWFVHALEDPGRSGSIAELAAGQRFRLVYQSPPVLPGMEETAALLWQGKLESPAFSGWGGID